MSVKEFHFLPQFLQEQLPLLIFLSIFFSFLLWNSRLLLFYFPELTCLLFPQGCSLHPTYKKKARYYYQTCKYFCVKTCIPQDNIEDSCLSRKLQMHGYHSHLNQHPEQKSLNLSRSIVCLIAAAIHLHISHAPFLITTVTFLIPREVHQVGLETVP